jgi:hypothetical protein
MQHGLLRRFHDLPLLERAARCAVGCWFNIEQGLCKAVQNAQGPNEILSKEWFRYWGVARTFRTRGDRKGIRARLFEELPRLKAAPPNAQSWGLVQQLSTKIKPMNCDIRPTSLVSKFAFSCCPATFVPYDRIARGQLRTSDQDYVTYRREAAKHQADVKEKLAKFIRPSGQVGLTSQHLPLYGKSMNQQVFVARAADWYLLLRGGFDPIAARNPVHCDLMI